jgi:hypothetical protein
MPWLVEAQAELAANYVLVCGIFLIFIEIKMQKNKKKCLGAAFGETRHE